MQLGFEKEDVVFAVAAVTAIAAMRRDDTVTSTIAAVGVIAMAFLG